MWIHYVILYSLPDIGNAGVVQGRMDYVTHVFPELVFGSRWYNKARIDLRSN